MGDTFDRVQEIAKSAAMRQKAEFVVEYYFLLDETDFIKSGCLMIVEKESIGEEGPNEDRWEGKIGALKSYFKATFKSFYIKQ